MSFMAQRDMTREQQIEEAAKFAGVPAAVIDGIWRTESNRGQHATMVGPDTKWGKAKGHFQQLDGIVKTWSQRLGKELDPFDFSDGLTMMAHQLKENMGIYKGSVDKSVMAYHGGTNQANWGPKTQKYRDLVLGKGGTADVIPRQERTVATPDGEGKRPHMSADAIWTADNDLRDQQINAIGDMQIAHGTAFNVVEDNGELLTARRMQESEALARQQEINNRTFFGDVLPAAYQNTMNPSFRIAARIFADPGEYKQDAAFMANQRDNWAKATEGFEEHHEKEFLLNAVNEQDYARRKFHLTEQRRTAQIVAEDGWRGMGAMFLAGAADPMTYVTGLGAMKATALAAKGATMYASQGRTGAAIASSFVENAMGNIAYEAVQQAFGEHRTIGDYAMAGMLGVLPAAISTPGLVKYAAASRVQAAARAKIERDIKEFEEVVQELGPNATAEEIKTALSQREAQRVQEQVEATRGGRAVAPENQRRHGEHESPEALAEAEAELRAEAEARKPAPQPEPEQPKVEIKATEEGVEAQVKQPKPQPEAQAPQPKPIEIETSHKLPTELAGAKPTYSFGNKRFSLEFNSDVERALYIIAGTKSKSSADPRYLEWLSSTLGRPEHELRQLGQLIRAEIKEVARKAEKGGKLRVENALIAAESRKLGAKAEGAKFQAQNPGVTTVKLGHAVVSHAGQKRMGTVRDLLNELVRNGSEAHATAAELLLARTTNAGLFDAPVWMANGVTPHYHPADGNLVLNRMLDTGAEGPSIRLHESVHSATSREINAAKAGKGSPQTRAAYKRLKELFDQSSKDWMRMRADFARTHGYGEDTLRHIDYAFKNEKEFLAQAIMDKGTQQFLMSLPGKRSTSVWREFVEVVGKLLGIKETDTRFAEVMDALDMALQATETTRYLDSNGKVRDFSPDLAKAPVVDPIDSRWGLDVLPDTTPTERAKKKAMRALARDIEKWAQENPVNKEATKTVMDNEVVNMATPATLLAKSDHPAARWMSAVLLEQTMGAHGRGPNAAIAAHTLAQEYAGNFQYNFDNLYATWRNETVGLVRGVLSDIIDMKHRREFNRLVAMEIEGRLLGYPESPYKQVREAANAAEQQFELMRLEQINNKTPGFSALPETSRGYLPHLLDSGKVAAMSIDQRRAFIGALKDQFMNGFEDMDEQFAEKVARAYVKHATDRAAGLSDIPADPLNHQASAYIKQAAEAEKFTYEELKKLNTIMAKGAATHTKKRLKMDTLKKYRGADGKEFQLIDLFRQDINDIVRVHARRVAGEVALTRFGVHGSSGLELLRELVSLGGEFGKLDNNQLKAMKQTHSELLGRPVDLSEESQALNGLITYTSLTKLGGMGFTQLGEYSNMMLHLGLAETMKAATDIPRLISEVRRLARGEKVENGIIGSMEFRGGGGEFGVEGYRISHFDTSGREFEAYGQSSSGPVLRALKKAQYGMGIVSMHRAVQAAQQRGAAEQIVLKVWRKIKSGEDLGVALKDMGFDDKTVAALKEHMDSAVEFDANGRVKTFEITKLPPELQVQFDQSVRRGVYQIIQGTFIGERGHWNHSQLGRLLTQFRNYPITAMEKQLGRTITNHGGGARGVAVAAGMVIASAGIVLPVYAARVAWNASTREDRDEYIERMFSPEEVLKNVMNYMSITGLLPDVMQGLFSAAGSLNEDWKWTENTGGRTGAGATTLGTLVPAVGSIEELLRLPANTNDPHKLFRALPYSNTPALTPFIEALRN